MSIREASSNFKLRDLAYTFVGVAGLFLLFLTVNHYLIKSEDFFVLLSLQWLSMLLPLLVLCIRRFQPSLKKFKEIFALDRRPSIWSIIKWNIGAYASFFLIMLAISYVSNRLNINIPGFGEQDSHLPLLGTGPNALFYGFIFIAIVAPIIEEIFFRGFILQTLAQLGRYTGSIITAVIFAGIHFEFSVFWGLFILSLIINELFLQTRSLWVPISFHILNNSIAFAIEYLLLTQ